MRIEKALIEDLPEILELQTLAFQSEAVLYNDFSISPLVQTLEEIQKEYHEQVFLKVVIKGRIIGSVRALEKGSSIHIGRLIVHPEFQNKGIGTKLMKQIEALFPNAKRYELFTGYKSEKNIHLYKKLGYRIFKEKQINNKLTFVEMEKVKSEKRFELDDIVLIGRTFDEYFRMLGLNELNLKVERILDVASGVSSFCAEASTKGYNVKASDKIYRFSPHEIEEKCKKDLNEVIAKMPEVRDMYKWDYFKDINDLRKNREIAYKLFLQDFKGKGQSRYIYADYPQCPFKNREFTISLISGFLFLYDDKLDYELHKKILLEIIRITSREIRIFPIINLNYQRSPFMERIIHDPDFGKCTFTIKKVDYEFVKGGNEMMIIGVKQ